MLNILIEAGKGVRPVLHKHLPDASEELLEVWLDRCVGVDHEDSFGDSAAVLPQRLQTHVCQTTQGVSKRTRGLSV